MEFAAEPRPFRTCNLLGVPVHGCVIVDVDADEDDCEVVIGIRPKSSPLPRRRSSESSDDSEPELPPSRSRRVSFADAVGLNLVAVKEFEQWDLPKLPGHESLDGKRTEMEEYCVSTLFSLPQSPEEVMMRVNEQKLELESIQLLPGTTILKGVICVLNLSFDKKVYVRTSLDAWANHFDLLAEYVPGSSDGVTDCFSFKITLVPPFGEQGARVDFCLRYETSVGTFWNNNDNRNYVVFCHQKVKEAKEKPQKENRPKKSCLKPARQDNSDTWSATENSSSDVLKCQEELSSAKTQQISAYQEELKELQVENSRNYSRRNRRRAVRMARVRDYFSQRNGEASDKESEETVQGEDTLETPVSGAETHTDPMGKNTSRHNFEVPPDSVTTSDKLCHVVHQETSPAQGTTSNEKSEESRSIDSGLQPFASERVGEANTALTNSQIKSKLTSQNQNFSKSVTSAAEDPQRQMQSNSVSMKDESTNYTGDNVYCPLTDRRESNSQNVADPGNILKGGLNIGDSTSTCAAQKYPLNESEDCLSASVGVTSSPTEIPQASSGQCTANSKDTQVIFDDVMGHPRNQGISNTDVVKVHIPCQYPQLQGKGQEDTLMHDPQCDSPPVQATAEATQSQPPEDTMSHVQTQLDTAISEGQIKTETVLQLVAISLSAEIDLQTSDGGVIHHKCVDEINKEEDIHSTMALRIKSNEDQNKPEEKVNKLEVEPQLYSATSKLDNNPAGHQIISLSSAETGEEKRNTGEDLSDEKQQNSPQEQKEPNNIDVIKEVTDNSIREETNIPFMDDDDVEVAELFTRNRNSSHTYADVIPDFRVEDVMKTKQIVVSERKGLGQVQNVPSKQEDIGGDETVEENWEKMVEEEERDVLGNEQSSTETEHLEMEIKEVEEAKGQVEVQTLGEVGMGMEERLLTAEIAVEEARDGFEEEDKDENIRRVIEENDSQGAKIREEEEKELDLSEEEEEMEVDLSEEEEEMEVDLSDEEEEVEVELEEEPVEERLTEKGLQKTVTETQVTGELKGVELRDRKGEMGVLEQRLAVVQIKSEAKEVYTPVSDVHECVREILSDIENEGEEEKIHGTDGIHVQTEEDEQGSSDTTNDKETGDDNSEREENDSVVTEAESCILKEDPKNDQMEEESDSSESLSDDEVELYMRCLRAVQKQSVGLATRDRSKDIGLSAGKRPSISRGKQLASPLPSISESACEERPCADNDHEKVETVESQPPVSPKPEQKSSKRNFAWWRETFSCRNIAKALLFTVLLLVFFVVAYHYDFLACFVLYLISVVWLCCYGEKKQVKTNNRLT